VGVSILWYEESIGSIPGEYFGFLQLVVHFHEDLGCSLVLFHRWAGPGELGLPRRENQAVNHPLGGRKPDQEVLQQSFFTGSQAPPPLLTSKGMWENREVDMTS